MGKRGRKAHIDPPVNFVLSIPQSLAAKVELLLYDPTTGKPAYGGRSALIQQLLREWVESQLLTRENKPPIINPLPNQPHPNGHSNAETPNVE